MRDIKKLKDILGERYRFKQYVPSNQIERLLGSELEKDVDYVLAVLEVGMLKAVAVMYVSSAANKIQQDIYVSINQKGDDFVCYANIEISPKRRIRNLEKEMFKVLDRVVRENDLSYIACSFEVLEYKKPKTRGKA